MNVDLGKDSIRKTIIKLYIKIAELKCKNEYGFSPESLIN